MFYLYCNRAAIYNIIFYITLILHSLTSFILSEYCGKCKEICYNHRLYVTRTAISFWKRALIGPNWSRAACHKNGYPADLFRSGGILAAGAYIRESLGYRRRPHDYGWQR
jgi:hypothetical protein